MSSAQNEGGPIVIHPAVTGAADVEPTENVTTLVLTDARIAAAGPPPPAPFLPAALPRISGERALGVDALRGMLLLAMTFAMTIPFGPFPNWMYHMQYPPPSGDFVQLAGLTWRDLLFAGFLFTMSVAIPITNTSRLVKGMPYPAIVFSAVKRGALLYLFALLIGHVNPYWTGDYTKRGNLLAIAGFLVCWPIFLRYKPTWRAERVRAAKIAGWAGAAAILFAAPLLYDSTFAIGRRDGIIAALAVTAVLGTTTWVFTRRLPVIRVALIAALCAGKLAAQSPGWIQNVWGATPAAWLYESWYLELMIVVLAGTLVGDLLLQWMAPRDIPDAESSWSARRLAAIAFVCGSLTPIAVVGLYQRNLPLTAASLLGVASVGAVLMLKPRAPRDVLLIRLFGFAVFWILIGLIVEPVEGGIRKVPQTLSYLTMMTGLSTSLLITALITTDLIKAVKRPMRVLAEVGQNPLLAYVAFMLFVNHIAYGAGIGRVGTGAWLEATVRGAILTAIAAGIVWLASRRKLFWRA